MRVERSHNLVEFFMRALIASLHRAVERKFPAPLLQWTVTNAVHRGQGPQGLPFVVIRDAEGRWHVGEYVHDVLRGNWVSRDVEGTRPFCEARARAYLAAQPVPLASAPHHTTAA
jgi:hypothetical protein